MAITRDKSYDMLFNLEDSGYQGLGGPVDNPISYLINQPSNPGEFLKMNENILDEGRVGILSALFNAFKNPFSSLYDENEIGELNLDSPEKDTIEEEDITKTAIGTDKIKLKQTPSGGRGINKPRY
jgi:hypothetical protein